MKNGYKLLTTTVLTAGLLLAGAARADEVRPSPPAYGPGMMGGYGGGYGPGYGYGPGMMGGYGRSGGWGNGWGGMGSMMGMMGITGHGMGLWPYYALDLNEQQRSKMSQIQDEMRKKNWEVVGKLVDEQARLRDLYAADKRDAAAIGKQTMKIAELRRQLVEASVDAHNRIEALLSKEQKERLRGFGRGWMMDAD
jgi:Spy/CpxP family protein refolding chaperone